MLLVSVRTLLYAIPANRFLRICLLQCREDLCLPVSIVHSLQVEVVDFRERMHKCMCSNESDDTLDGFTYVGIGVPAC